MATSKQTDYAATAGKQVTEALKKAVKSALDQNVITDDDVAEIEMDDATANMVNEGNQLVINTGIRATIPISEYEDDDDDEAPEAQAEGEDAEK